MNSLYFCMHKTSTYLQNLSHLFYSYSGHGRGSFPDLISKKRFRWHLRSSFFRHRSTRRRTFSADAKPRFEAQLAVGEFVAELRLRRRPTSDVRRPTSEPSAEIPTRGAEKFRTKNVGKKKNRTICLTTSVCDGDGDWVWGIFFRK